MEKSCFWYFLVNGELRPWLRFLKQQLLALFYLPRKANPGVGHVPFLHCMSWTCL